MAPSPSWCCVPVPPSSIRGVDPSSGQLEFARQRPGAQAAEFLLGDGHTLPFENDSADIAVMALVIFFLDDPAAGIAEMRRVVRPGGLVAAYAWDIPARAFPLEPIQAEMRAIGLNPALPPNAAIATTANLEAAWQAAGIVRPPAAHDRRHPAFRRFRGFLEVYARHRVAARSAR